MLSLLHFVKYLLSENIQELNLKCCNKCVKQKGIYTTSQKLKNIPVFLVFLLIYKQLKSKEGR